MRAIKSKYINKSGHTKLYTLIMDFRGGTYISQVPGHEPHEAMMEGIANLPLDGIEYMGARTKEALLEEASYSEPVEIEGHHNVYIATLSPFGHFTVIHMIQTAQD